MPNDPVISKITKTHLHSGAGCRSLIHDYLTADREVLFVCSTRTKISLLKDPSFLGLKAKAHWLEGNYENPTVSFVNQLFSRTKSLDVSDIVAIGGGSVIDSAKFLRQYLQLHNRQNVEVKDLFGSGFKKDNDIRLIVMPTTIGSGSEVTPFATVWDSSTEEKKFSLSGTNIAPNVAMLDPVFLQTLPFSIGISSGLDSMCHALESIWNRNRTSDSLELSKKALALSTEYLPQYVSGSFDQTTMEKLQKASLLAGLAISETKTSLCHAISYPITAMYSIPHGMACAITLPEVYRHCLEYGFMPIVNLDLEYKNSLYPVLRNLNLGSGLKELLESNSFSIKVVQQYFNSIIKSPRIDNFIIKPSIDDLNLILTRSFTLLRG